MESKSCKIPLFRNFVISNLRITITPSQNFQDLSIIYPSNSNQTNLLTQVSSLVKKLYTCKFEKSSVEYKKIKCPLCLCEQYLKLSQATSNIKISKYKQYQCQQCRCIIYYVRSKCEQVFYSIFNFSIQKNEVICDMKCCIIFKRCSCGEIINPISKIPSKKQNMLKNFNAISSSVLCFNCKKQTDYFFCNCTQQQLIMREDGRSFKFGQIIICPNPKCPLKSYLLLRCPNILCFQINSLKINGQYDKLLISKPINCKSCQCTFSWFQCPNCQDTLYIQDEVQMIETIFCSQCLSYIQIWRCDKCQHNNFQILQQAEMPNFQIRKCSHCETTSFNYFCEVCSSMQFYSRTNILYGYWYECQTCQKQKLSTYYKFYYCNICSMTSVEKSAKPLKNFGKIQCLQSQCPNHLQKQFNIFYCQTCKSTFIINGQAKENQEISCPNCKSIFELILCKNCNTYNCYSSKCANCISCKQILQGTLQKQSDAEILGQKCLVCQNRLAQFIYQNCLHYGICDQCAKNPLYANKCIKCQQNATLQKVFI